MAVALQGGGCAETGCGCGCLSALLAALLSPVVLILLPFVLATILLALGIAALLDHQRRRRKKDGM